MKSKKRGQRGLGRGLEALLASSADSNTPVAGGLAETAIAETVTSGLSIPAVIKSDAAVAIAQHDNQTSQTALAATTAIHQKRLEILAEAYALMDLLDEFEKLVRSEGLANSELS